MSHISQVQRFAIGEELLQHSPLVAHGGACITSLLDPGHLSEITRDAFNSHRSAVEQRVVHREGEDETRGDPERWLEMAPGGSPLQSFYESAKVLRLLANLTGLPWTSAGGFATFSYYRRQGHHLGLHRDLEMCDLAIITCVYDDAGTETLSGGLCLYPERSSGSLAAIRDDPRQRLIVRLQPGQSLVILGGQIPHCLLPMRYGHTRIVAPLCYQLAM